MNFDSYVHGWTEYQAVSKQFNRYVESSRTGGNFRVTQVQHKFYVGLHPRYGLLLLILLAHYPARVVRTGLDFYRKLMVYWSRAPLNDTFSGSHLGSIDRDFFGTASLGTDGDCLLPLSPFLDNDENEESSEEACPGESSNTSSSGDGSTDSDSSSSNEEFFTAATGEVVSWKLRQRKRLPKFLEFSFKLVPPSSGDDDADSEADDHSTLNLALEEFLEESIRFHQFDVVEQVISTMFEARPFEEVRSFFLHPSNEKNIPLIYVAVFYSRSASLVAFLLRRLYPNGPDSIPEDRSGRSAIYLAAQVHGNEEIVRNLRKAGATVDIRQRRKWTPLHNAADEANTKMVKLLLTLGAEPDLTTDYGMTALHLAAYGSHSETCQALIDGGADVTILCRGESAMDRNLGSWWDNQEKDDREVMATALILIQGYNQKFKYKSEGDGSVYSKDEFRELVYESVMEENKAALTKLIDKSEELAAMLFGLADDVQPSDSGVYGESKAGHDRFQILYDEPKLGTGGFGAVYKGVDKKRNAFVAVKESKLTNITDEAIAELQQEFELLRFLHHKNIVSVYGMTFTNRKPAAAAMGLSAAQQSSTTSGSFIAGVERKGAGPPCHREEAPTCEIYMEYMAAGSVLNIIEKGRGFRLHEGLIRDYLRDALEGLAYLHASKIVHRDVKPANLLVNEKGVLKVSDFGTSLFAAPKPPMNIDVQDDKHPPMAQKSGGESMPPRQGSTSFPLQVVGTAMYMSPEAVHGKQSPASDLWGLGCSVIQMATGKVPWAHLDPKQQSPLNMMYFLANLKPKPKPAGGKVDNFGSTPQIPGHLSFDLRQILQKMLSFDPSSRGCAESFLRDPYFLRDVLPSSAEALQDFHERSEEFIEQLKHKLFEEKEKRVASRESHLATNGGAGSTQQTQLSSGIFTTAGLDNDQVTMGTQGQYHTSSGPQTGDLGTLNF